MRLRGSECHIYTCQRTGGETMRENLSHCSSAQTGRHTISAPDASCFAILPDARCIAVMQRETVFGEAVVTSLSCGISTWLSLLRIRPDSVEFRIRSLLWSLWRTRGGLGPEHGNEPHTAFMIRTSYVLQIADSIVEPNREGWGGGGKRVSGRKMSQSNNTRIF